MEYTRKQRRFFAKGLGLHRPADALDGGHYPILTNVRAKDEGVLESRAGLSAINSSAIPSAVHSIKRLNDDVGPTLSTPLQAYMRLLGASTKLYSDNSAHTSFSEIDSGYSGDPLSIIVHRPEQSPQPWAYVFDSARKRKVRVDGTDYGVGIAGPTKPPSAALGSPATKTIDDFEAATFGGWSGGGAAFGVLTNINRVAAVAISQILYDTSTTGWACVNPASIADIRPGMFLTTSASAESVLVFSVSKAVTSTTIGSVKYDAGTSGLCTIQLAGPTAEIQVDAMLRNTTRSENVRVISVTYGPDGIPSIRCSTSATFAATDTITGLDSFRAYFASNHTTAETLSTKAIQFTVTATGITYVERTVALDLSVIGTRPVLPDDEVVITLQVDDPSKVTTLQIQLDVDRSTNDFTRNYYWHEVRPSDLTPAVTQDRSLISVEQSIIQRRQIETAARQSRRTFDDGGFGVELQNIDDFLPPDFETGETASGASQWTVIRVKVRDFQRTGSDLTRGWRDVQKLRISASVTAAVTVKADAWHVSGSHVLDTSDGSPYFYRYRYRNRETGAPSPWGPPIRSGIEPRHQSVVLTPDYSSDAQADLIDWIRKGGTLSDWRYVSTTPNSGTFTDDYSDASIEENPVVIGDGAGIDSPNQLATFDAVQPFPVVDSPRTGTCDVSGTEVTRVSGDTFNTAWFRGNLIIIDGTPFRMYANPSSTSRLSLETNAGTKTGVTWVVSDAVMTGKEVDAAFGPYGNGIRGIVFFGVRQGTLYWTAGNNPDLCRIADQTEVTGGSETLMNGCIWDDRPYLASNQRWFEVDDEGADGFKPRGLAHTTGLFSRWACCVGKEGIYYLGSDCRIYVWAGSATDISGDLGALLPRGSYPATTVNGYLPPDLTQTSKLRFAYADGILYFDFQDTGGNLRTLLFDTKSAGWFYDDYTPDALVHYAEEGKGVKSLLLGCSDGRAYQASGTADGVTAISARVRTACENLDDFKAEKTFGDASLDFNAAGATLTITAGFNSHTATLTPVTPTNSARGLSSPIALNDTQARDADLDITWSSTSSVKLYGYEIAGYAEPEDTSTRATDFTDGGSVHAKLLQGCRIECDTGGVERTVEVLGDEGVLIATLTINADGRSVVAKGFTPSITHLMRLNPTDSDTWKLYGVEWVFEIQPELVMVWETPETTLGFPAYFHLRDGDIMHLSTADVTLTVYVDGVPYVYTLEHGSGVYTKSYKPFQAVKGKRVKFRFESTEGFRLNQQDSVIRGTGWGESSKLLRPFGDISLQQGAAI